MQAMFMYRIITSCAGLEITASESSSNITDDNIIVQALPLHVTNYKEKKIAVPSDFCVF